MNLAIIFLTGLTTGGLSCLAVQGGLLASVIANEKDEAQSSRDQWLPLVTFLFTKFVAHILLGFFLGSLGSVVSLSQEVRLAFQAFTALYMFATAMNLLEVHPIFRYVVFQPPKFIQRIVRNTSKSRQIFTPAVLGLLTVFIPCGVTQAMEVLAINSANGVQGALIMGTFVLGTSPLFSLLGVLATKVSDQLYHRLTKGAAYLLIGMAVFSLNGVFIVLNSPITLNTLISPVTYFFSEERFSRTGTENLVTKDGKQIVTIEVLNSGYAPRYIKVKKDVPVELTLKSNKTYSCALSFSLPEFGIKTFLAATDTKTFSFVPTKSGKYTYTCSMGMYTGVLEVI